MGRRIRSLISSKYMYAFGLSPCSIEKAFPGLVEAMAHQNFKTRQSISIENKESVTENKRTEQPKGQSKWKVARATLVSGVNKNINNFTRKLEKEHENDSAFNNESQFCKFLAEKKFRTVVKNFTVLESEENMEFLWQYFAQFVDRVFLYLYSFTVVGICLRFTL